MNWHEAPFVRLLLPFIVGICVGLYLDNWLIFIANGSIGAIGILYILVQSYRTQLGLSTIRQWAHIAHLSLFSLGYVLTFLQLPQQQTTHFQHFIEENKTQLCIGYLSQAPQLRTSSMRSFMRVQAVQDSLGNWHESEGNILVNIALDSASTALQYGDKLLFRATLRPMSAPQNPYGLDLRTYYAVQHIYHQTYLGAEQWTKIDSTQGTVFQATIYQLQDYLVRIYKKHCPTENEYAVASALILGVRNDLNSEVINAYADTGAMHVLSVSGLHVGLIAWVLVWLLKLINSKRKSWIWTRTILLLLLIWGFAFLTGGSPPVLRSAAMFSFVMLGQMTTRPTNIYNSLASSAFFLLCFNPLWLLDVGFQLSYLALWGIVYFQPFIYKSWFIQHKFGDWAWNLTAVSLAATISTLPITLYYFHQFSFITFISGLVVIPLSTAILPIGLLLLMIDGLPFLGDFIGIIVYYLIWLLNACIFLMQSIPYSIIEGIWIEYWEMWAWYIGIFLATMAFIKQQVRWIIYSLSVACILAIVYNIKIYNATQQQLITVYNVYKGSGISFINGRQCITFIDSAHQNEKALSFMQQNQLWAHRVTENKVYNIQEDSIQTPFLIKNKQLFQYNNLRFAIASPTYLYENMGAPLAIDYLIISGNLYSSKVDKLQAAYDFKNIILDASNSRKTISYWNTWTTENAVNEWNILEKGAFVYTVTK